MDCHSVLERGFARNTGTALRERTADGARELSFEDLAQDVRQTAAGLQHRYGLEEGDRIAVLCRNSIDTFRLLLGAWYAGITVVEVKPRTTADNIGYYLEDAGADILFHDQELTDRVTAAGLSAETVPVTRDRLAELQQDGTGHPDGVDPETLLTISYTSGTTGRPKGVPVSHDRHLHGVMVKVIRDEVRDDDRVGLIYPYYGVGSQQLLACMMTGATLVLPEEREPGTVLEMIADEEITSIGGVPTQLKDLADAYDPDEHDTTSIRYVHTGSGLLTTDIYEDAWEALDPETFCTSYGSSEALETLYSLEDTTALGSPTYFQRVRLVEPGSGDPEAIVADEGELIVDASGPEVFDGYLNRPEATADALIDGWYFTGDVLQRDSDGNYHFQARVDDLIISGGKNIAPATVEDALDGHPDVGRCAVIGVPSERWGEKVVAMVRSDSGVTAEELDRFLRDASLEDYKRPKEYGFIEEFPTSETGGISRTTLRERWDELDRATP